MTTKLKKISEKYYPYFIVLLGGVFFFSFLGKTHLFDWDEINFAESAREMIVTGDYFRVRIGFLPFWEKPPFFFWLQAGAMKIFGINEFAARFPNALFGILTLLTIYIIGKKEKGARFGIIWVLLFFGSILPHLYFKSGIIDPVFNYCIFTATYFLMKAMDPTENRFRNAAISGALIGVAIITKGPVGFLLLFLTFLSIIILEQFKKWPRIKDVVIFMFITLLVTSFWYGIEVITNGPQFLIEFINYQIDLFSRPVADHEQPIYYHFLVILFGCFPMSVLALGSFTKSTIKHHLFAKWMMSLFFVVMILFTIVTTKIVHYSSLAYLPLSYLAALYCTPFTFNKYKKIPSTIKYLYLFIGLLLGLLLISLPLIILFKDTIIPYINDDFVVAGLLKPVHWSNFEFLIGVLFIIAVLGSAFYLFKNRLSHSIAIISGGTATTLLLYSIFIIPKIEQHTQGSLISFLQSVEGEDVYITTVGFYSYAPFFYFKQPNNKLVKRSDSQWLINGDIDKPVYIISKITDTNLSSLLELEFIKEEGGYRFYLRQPK